MDETQWFHEAASQGCWNHMALHFLFCLPGGNHCSSSQPWTCLPAEHRPCSSQGPGKAKTRQRTSTAGSLLTTQETTRLRVNTVLEASLPPSAAVGSGPLSKPLCHCSPSQPEQLRQFSAFCISGPTSIFNYSYKTAVI